MQSEQLTTRPAEPIEALSPIGSLGIPDHLAALAEVYLGLILRSAPAALDSSAARAEGFALGLQAAQAITQPQYEQTTSGLHRCASACEGAPRVTSLVV